MLTTRFSENKRWVGRGELDFDFFHPKITFVVMGKQCSMIAGTHQDTSQSAMASTEATTRRRLMNRSMVILRRYREEEGQKQGLVAPWWWAFVERATAGFIQVKKKMPLVSQQDKRVVSSWQR
jgi:hypothetical protein